MKNVIVKSAILGVVLLAVLLVAGSAGAAPPMQDGPGGMTPGPAPRGGPQMPGPWGGPEMPGPWGGPEMPGPWGGMGMPEPWYGGQLEEEPASGTAVRIDFEVSGHKARPGLYEIRYPDGAVLTSWYAYGGATDSGWINNLELPRKTVWVDVVYVPGHGEPSVKLHILNPAPDTEYGWISQGMSHAIEVAWPDMPVRHPDAGPPVGPDGQPWGPEGWIGGQPRMMPSMGPSAPGPYGMPGGPGGPDGMPARPGS